MFRRIILALTLAMGLSGPAMAGADQALPTGIDCQTWNDMFPAAPENVKLELFREAVHQMMHSEDAERLMGIPPGTPKQRQLVAINSFTLVTRICTAGNPATPVALLLEESWLADLAAVQGLPIPELKTLHATVQGWLLGAPVRQGGP